LYSEVLIFSLGPVTDYPLLPYKFIPKIKIHEIRILARFCKGVRLRHLSLGRMTKLFFYERFHYGGSLRTYVNSPVVWIVSLFIFVLVYGKCLKKTTNTIL
jgi:hypothetical protein